MIMSLFRPNQRGHLPVSTRVFRVFRSVVECGYFFGKDYWGQEFKALRLYRGEDAKLK